MKLIQYNVTEEALANLEDRYKVVLAPTNPTEYKQLTSGIAELRTTRTTVESTRKELKAEALEWGRKVDAEAKRITERIAALEAPMKQLKLDYDAEKERIKREKEEAEAARIKAHRDRLDDISSLLHESHTLDVAILSLQTINITRWEDVDFEEFADEAANLIATTKDRLEDKVKSLEALEQQRIAQQKEAIRLAEERRLLEEQTREVNERMRAAEQAENERKQRALEERARLEAKEKDETKSEQVLSPENNLVDLSPSEEAVEEDRLLNAWFDSICAALNNSPSLCREDNQRKVRSITNQVLAILNNANH